MLLHWQGGVPKLHRKKKGWEGWRFHVSLDLINLDCRGRRHLGGEGRERIEGRHGRAGGGFRAVTLAPSLHSIIFYDGSLFVGLVGPLFVAAWGSQDSENSHQGSIISLGQVFSL